MNANSTRNVTVEGDGSQVVGHVGLHALGGSADRMGVGDALSQALGWQGPGVPVHDLILDAPAVVRAGEAVARIRSQVWTRSASTTGTGPVVLDLDASLVEIHSENKEGTAAHFKGGFGFHPVFCFADATGKALAATLRPGNATANDAADLLGVLDAGMVQLPADVMAGHCVADDLGKVRRRVVVRSDSAGCSAGFVDGCRSRNIGFQVVARRKATVSAAVTAANIDDDRWVRALDQDGIPAAPKPGGDKVAMVVMSPIWST